MIELKHRNLWLPACTLCAVLLTACGDGTSPAVEIDPNQLTTVLSADQESPPLELTASRGTAVLIVDVDTGAISGNVTVTGLSSAARMAHIHAGAAGINGPVVMTLNIDETGTQFDVPTGAALDAVGIDNYLNGELYINVHTDDYPAGEVRGQLIPANG